MGTRGDFLEFYILLNTNCKKYVLEVTLLFTGRAYIIIYNSSKQYISSMSYIYCVFVVFLRNILTRCILQVRRIKYRERISCLCVKNDLAKNTYYLYIIVITIIIISAQLRQAPVGEYNVYVPAASNVFYLLIRTVYLKSLESLDRYNSLRLNTN